MAPLYRAVPLAQVNGVALAVGEHLHFHVAWPDDGFFQDQFPGTESGLGFRPGQLDRIGQLCQVVYQAHAAASATGSGLYHQRRANPGALLEQDAIALVLAFIAGNTGHPGFYHAALGLGLVAHQVNGIRPRADENQAGVLAGPRQNRHFR